MGVKDLVVTFAQQELAKAGKLFALGLPSKDKTPDVPKAKGAKWVFAVQRHEARKAGTHLDLRLIDSKGRAHSWVLRGELPVPGESKTVIRQPAHEGDYATHTGRYAGKTLSIPSGYGAGLVHLQSSDPVDVLESGAAKITFVIPSGRVAQEYSLINLGGGKWKLINHSTTKDKYKITHHKPSYREKPFEEVSPEDTGKIMSAKIAGAHAILVLVPGRRPRLFSYRQSKRSIPLEYTFKMGMPFMTSRWPKGQPSMRIRGEVYAVDRRGWAIPEATLGGILNSTVDKARKTLRSGEYRMRFAPFQVESVKGKPFAGDYEDHLRLIGSVEKMLPDIHRPPMARTPREKRRLLKAIETGKLKETSEGVVEFDIANPERPTKAKILTDHDVVVREILKEKTRSATPLPKRPGFKYVRRYRKPDGTIEYEYEKQDRAGSFRYSKSPRGPILGSVGTGFSAVLKEYMARNPDKVKGLVAKVRAQGHSRSGALLKPRFGGWHYDKSDSRVAEVPPK